MKEDDSFEELVTLCIDAYGITFSDTVALDANGVIGKMRVLIMENVRYQRETRKLKARRTINDLKEVNELIEGINKSDEELPPEPEPEEEVVPEEVEEFDIRKKGAKAKKKPPQKKTPPKTTAKDIKKGSFDKSKIDTRLKLIQERREILSARSDEEEKTNESINIFFVAVTKEEFEVIETVEVSESTSSNADFDKSDDASVKTALGSAVLKEAKKSSVFHYEGEGDERTLIED